MKKTNAALPRILFAALFLGLFAARMRQYPYLYHDPQLILDEGANFWYASHVFGFWKSLFSTDAGYLPLLPRLISLVVAAVHVPTQYIPSAYHYATLFLVTLFQTMFALPFFRKFIRSDLARALVCLVLAARHKSVYLFLLFNTTYIGAVPFFLFLAMSEDVLLLSTAARIAISAFFCLALLSKPFFFGFVPILALYFVLALKKRDKKAAWLYGPPLAATAIQLGFMTYGQRFTVKLAHHSLTEQIWSLFAGEIQMLIRSTTGRTVAELDRASVVFYGFLFVLALFWFFKSRAQKTGLLKKALTPAGIAVITSTVTVAIMMQVFSDLFPVPVRHFPTLFGIWQVTVGEISLILGFAWVLYRLTERWTILVLASFAIWAFAIEQAHERFEPSKELTISSEMNWQGLGPTASEESFCIPFVWVGDFTAIRNCTFVNERARFAGMKEVNQAGYELPPQVAAKSVLWLGLLLSKEDRDAHPKINLLDAKGAVVGTASPVSPDHGLYTEFVFPQPVSGAARLTVTTDRGAHAQLETDQELGTPSWIWAFKGGPPSMQVDLKLREWADSSPVTYVSGDKQLHYRVLWDDALNTDIAKKPMPAGAEVTLRSYSKTGVTEKSFEKFLGPSLQIDFISLPDLPDRGPVKTKLTILAKAADETKSVKFKVGLFAGGRLQWKTFEAGSDFQPFVVEHDIGNIRGEKRGGLNFWSDLTGKGGGLVVRGISVEKLSP